MFADVRRCSPMQNQDFDFGTATRVRGRCRGSGLTTGRSLVDSNRYGDSRGRAAGFSRMLELVGGPGWGGNVQQSSPNHPPVWK